MGATTMGTEQKVAVITGASQGFGAGLVKAYRDRSYRVIANSRSIKPSKDSDVLTIAGDVADPKTADRIVQITGSLIDHANSNVPSFLSSMTKGGLNAGTKPLAIEYAKKGVGGNA